MEGQAALRRALVGAALLAGLAWGLHAGRAAFILALFPDGQPGAAPPLPRPEAGPPLPPVDRTRVVLIDGLGLAAARGLPHLERLCAGGLDLTVDVGFPTVSLPVQHVLWSGLTQQESGVQYRVGGYADPRPGLPGRVPGSVAAADAHPEIVHSFGFATVYPPRGAAVDAAAFLAEARAAVASDAQLAFVHLLGVDIAGHKGGGAASARYAAAAADADRVLGELLAAPPSPARLPTERWFVLADHGHRPAGGHGDAEPELRLVRACVAGELPAGLPGGRRLHLVDLARAVADSTGTALPGAGRPLAAALTAPADGATLPRPGAARWLCAGALLLAGLGVSLTAARRAPATLPLWGPVAWALVWAQHGLPTLSNPVLWPRLPERLLFAAAPAALLVLSAAFLARRVGLGALAAGQLGLPLGALAAALALVAGRPPLVPFWTAQVMLLGALSASAALLLALAALARAARARFDRSGSPGPTGTRA